MRRLAAAALLAVLACGAAAREAGRDDGKPHPPSGLAFNRLEPGAWVIAQTQPWPANALLVETGPEQLVLVDALYTPQAARELLAWVDKRLPGRRLLALNTHFHSDRSGGNSALLERKVPVYAAAETVALMKSRGREVMNGVARAIQDDEQREAFLSAPIAPADGAFSLERGLALELGERVEVRFHGAGHSPDNVVVWFPKRRILFGGCLVLSAGKLGNVSDANLPSWRKAVAELARYDARLVIPGHGWNFSPSNLEGTAKALEPRAQAAPAAGTED